MRSFYSCEDGREADICEMLGRDETRLTIRDSEGKTVSREHFRWYGEALDALREDGKLWTNDITGEVLPPL